MNARTSPFLGAVRIAGVSPAANPARTRRIGLRLGQLPWPINQTPGTTPSGGVETRCYRCGLNAPRLMQPSAASLNPSCVEVDASLCAGQQAEIDQSGAAPGVGAGVPGANPVLTRASLTVFEPRELKGLPNADVQVLSVSPYDGSTVEVGKGVTGADGKYEFAGNAPRYPAPNNLGAAPGNLRFVVTSGVGAPNFPSVQAETRNQGEQTMPLFVSVCTDGTSDVVCEVAHGQAMWKTILEQQLRAWNYYTTGRPTQVAVYAADQAHAAVMNGLNPQDSRLRQGWMQTYSWWIGVLDIPPKDWPDLLSWSGQVASIFGRIPFPQWPGIEDYFTRCAAGIPFAMAAGKDGENFNFANPKLYSATFSNYFPRSDKLIERDMAAAYSDGLQAILRCMVHRIKQKTKELERAAKAMSLISLGTIVAFSPFLIAAGPSGVTVLATEAYEFTVMQTQGVGVETYGVTAALAAAMIAAGNIDFVTAALEPALGDALSDMDPVAAQAVKSAYPQIVESASEAVLGPDGIGTGFESGGGAVGGAALAMAIKMIAGIAKSYAANRIEEFQDAGLGAQQAAADIMAVAEGREAGPYFKPFIQWVVQALGLLDIFEQAIDDFLDQFESALEEGAAQGGGITVVEEEGGGGPAIVPTNPEGVPTDAEGAPLPDGKAPLTKPTSTVTPYTSTEEILGYVGAGGAAAGLLAVASGLV